MAVISVGFWPSTGLTEIPLWMGDISQSLQKDQAVTSVLERQLQW